MVGLAMGIHATIYGLAKGVDFELFDMILYLPVSAMYIISMTIGYVGLRYIELSIAAPVQNSSGAMSAILLFIFFPRELSLLRSEEHTSELQSRFDLVCRLLLEKKK